MKIVLSYLVALLILWAPVIGSADEALSSTNTADELQQLRSRIETLEKKNLEIKPATGSVPAGAAQSATAPQTPLPESMLSKGWRSFQSFNPEISAIVDMFYHADDSADGISHVTEEMSGFGHSHGDEDHHHGETENGFNLRHLELQFSAEVDPYFKGSAIAAIDLEGAEMEEAKIETTCLPWGFAVRGGKFFSDFGYINAQHSHQWDFVDQPLIYQLTLGPHGLNDVGAQLSWLAPTPFYLLAALEAFQGKNDMMFVYSGEDPLPHHNGPRVGVGWLKFGPDLPGNHGLQAGVFGAIGRDQEAHDGNEDGNSDHWLDGDSMFWGADCVYKYDSPQPHCKGDLTLQAEYFNRRKDLEMIANDLNPALVGNDRIDDQDGYYLQAVYGLFERWRGGLRWEQVGLINSTELPDGSKEDFGSSYRAGVMLDFTPSEFSRLRVQVNHGSYETADGREPVTEFFLQWMISLGTHGAHKF